MFQLPVFSSCFILKLSSDMPKLPSMLFPNCFNLPRASSFIFVILSSLSISNLFLISIKSNDNVSQNKKVTTEGKDQNRRYGTCRKWSYFLLGIAPLLRDEKISWEYVKSKNIITHTVAFIFGNCGSSSWTFFASKNTEEWWFRKY